MLNTKQPVLRRFWYAVMPVDLLKDGPRPFTLLGEPIVLFLDANGEPAALEDRCCHRTARLSKGWCKNGNIVCGYHGWEYDRDGTLVMIPQFPFEQPIPDAKARSFRAQTRYGYIWVALDEPLSDIPDVPEDRDVAYRRIHQFYDKWNTAALRLMENSFDNAHFSTKSWRPITGLTRKQLSRLEIHLMRPRLRERQIPLRKDTNATNGSCRSAGGSTWNIPQVSGISFSIAQRRYPTVRFKSFKSSFATTPRRTALRRN